MSDNDSTQASSTEPLQRAQTRRISRLSPIWIVPVVAIMIGLWLAYDSYVQRGVLVTLSMPSAEGIQAGKTTIKTRNVDIGQVEKVQLSEDLSEALVYARINPEAEKMLVEGSRFWVVKPRIGWEGVSGLGTVLSGTYIQLQPGSSDVAKKAFQIEDKPPVTLDSSQGIRLNLTSQLDKSLRAGAPVTYQGVTVGRVETAELDLDSREMQHQLFIEKPYDALITENTRFWPAKSFDLNLTSAGVDFNIDSLEALMSGGVTFGVRESIENDRSVQDGHEFTLYANEEAALQGNFDLYLEYVLLIEDTVRGLKNGAPVEYRGIRVGTVMEVPWEFTSDQRNAEQGYAIPVLIRLEPQRLDPEGELSVEEWRERLLNMMQGGLRASLKSGNLLAGSLFVDLNFIDDAEPIESLSQFENVAVIPSTPSGLAQLEVKVFNLLDKFNALEVEPLIASLEQNLQTSDAMLEEVRTLVQDFRVLAKDPALKAAPANLNQVLIDIQETLTGYNNDSQAYQDLTRSLRRLDNILRDLQPAAKQISEQPSTLIFGRPETEDPQPTAPSSGESQ